MVRVCVCACVLLLATENQKIISIPSFFSPASPPGEMQIMHKEQNREREAMLPFFCFLLLVSNGQGCPGKVCRSRVKFKKAPVKQAHAEISENVAHPLWHSLLVSALFSSFFYSFLFFSFCWGHEWNASECFPNTITKRCLSPTSDWKGNRKWSTQGGQKQNKCQRN